MPRELHPRRYYRVTDKNGKVHTRTTTYKFTHACVIHRDGQSYASFFPSRMLAQRKASTVGRFGSGFEVLEVEEGVI